MSIARNEVEGTVVDGTHTFVFRGLCLHCHRPEYAPGCEGAGAVPRDTVTLGEPEPRT